MPRNFEILHLTGLLITGASQAINERGIIMDKSVKKSLLKQYKEIENEKFIKSLPIPKETFYELFDFLDEQLEEHGCNHSLDLTTAFLASNKIDSKPIIDWIIEHGQGCDCEVLANIEERFEM